MGGLGRVIILGDMGLEYGNEKRVCTPFDVVLAFFISVLIVLKFVGEYVLMEIGKKYDKSAARTALRFLINILPFRKCRLFHRVIGIWSMEQMPGR